MKIRNAMILDPAPRYDHGRLDSLFGDDLDNAEYDPEVWSIDDEGILRATKDDMIWAKDEYENYSLDFEFKTTEKANSGVVIQCTDKENWIPNSFEVQIFDSYGRDVDMSDCGAIYGRCAPEFNVMKAPGEWNRMTINVMRGNVTVILNDHLITSWNKALWTKADENRTVRSLSVAD